MAACGSGTVFRMTTNGTWTTLKSLDTTNGAYPRAGLTLGTDGYLYGTTTTSSNGSGAVLRVTTNGTVTTIAVFGGLNGSDPYAGLTLGADASFYGTTIYGGDSGGGTLFRVTTHGLLTTLVSFNGTNGLGPTSALALGQDGDLYGTTGRGGTNVNSGTIFRFTPDYHLETILSFPAGVNADTTTVTVGPRRKPIRNELAQPIHFPGDNQRYLDHCGDFQRRQRGVSAGPDAGRRWKLLRHDRLRGNAWKRHGVPGHHQRRFEFAGHI